MEKKKPVPPPQYGGYITEYEADCRDAPDCEGIMLCESTRHGQVTVNRYVCTQCGLIESPVNLKLRERVLP